MSFLHMGFPPKKDATARKSISSETTEMSDGGGLVFGSSVGEESAADFWPIQHPIEPPPGDKPVECPLPNSSLINEWRVSRRRVAEPTSKRRHSVSHDGDHYRSLIFPNKNFNTSTSLKLNKLNQFRH